MDRDTLTGFYFELGMSYRDILKILAALHGIIFDKEGRYEAPAPVMR